MLYEAIRAMPECWLKRVLEFACAVAAAMLFATQYALFSEPMAHEAACCNTLD